jgi:DNA repair protein SbcC/Rad50
MIVAALDIENYKHYRGTHRIEFPAQGIVSVTGPNGAGKTTLFEAIEWCLYCPRTIPQATVPPHDGVGRTMVTVTLEDIEDGKRYCVQRELRSAGTQAEIYLEENPSSPLVQGTREVSRYVARHLIGLPHAAFVSTFFTKQKELQFFGDRSATERRTEVGRLLGLEAVREAQREIGEGRSATRSQAESLRGEYVRRLGDRDLDAEMESASLLFREVEAGEAAAEVVSQRTAADAEHAREELERMRDLQGRDAAFAQDLAEIAGAVREAAARRDAAVGELARLESRAAERMELAATAARVECLTAEVTRIEEERERARRLQMLREAQRAADERSMAAISRLERTVNEHQAAAAGLEGWLWSEADAVDPCAAARRLHAVAMSLDPAESRSHAEALQDALHLAAAAKEIADTLQKYDWQREKLTKQRDELLALGDPDLALSEARLAVREAREEEQLARSLIAAARVEREEDERLAVSLRQHVEDPICPTCTRPLGPQEAERLAALLDAKITRLQEDERGFVARAHAAAERNAAAERAEADARTRTEAVKSLIERLADGQRLTEEATERHHQASNALRDALHAIGAPDVPSLDAVAAARSHAERIQRVAGLAGLLDRLSDDVAAAQKARDDAEQQIADLGDVRFDDAELQAAMEALGKARRAAAYVERIDIELANRAQCERQQVQEGRTLADLATQQLTIATRRAELAFDPAKLRLAIESEQAAREAAHLARDRHTAARHAVRDAQAAQERIEAEHRHLRKLIEEADQKTREADELTRMYDEFGEFDRYVARHVGPLLAETTERMLSQVTNGKYDHIQFDENYGIEVFDGDEAFPLGGFSGGERDVVALCARLALSEVVGSAALRPPRFLVLDEVFGSLDSERRTQLLETLGSLAHGGHFHQMFIISHVDDVQQSPVMSEAWTVEERDGVSRVIRPDSHFPSLA